MRSALLAFALLLSTALAPLALAQETSFAHRYVVYGRVVDKDAYALQGLLVDGGLPAALGRPADCPIIPGTELEALGSARTQRRTGEAGDFIFCFDIGELPADPGRGAIHIAAANFTQDFAVDPVTRVTFLNLQLPIALEANRTDAINESHRVIARLWRPAPEGTRIEDVPVRATVLAGEPVTLQLDIGGGIVIEGKTRTNDHGDIAVDIPLPARLRSGIVTLMTEDGQMRLPAEATTGMTPFSFEVPPSKALSPGTTIALGILAIALIGAAVWAVARRPPRK